MIFLILTSKLKVLKNVYKILEERKLQKEAKKNLKELKTNTKSEVVYKQNPDPFEIRSRRKGITPASKTYIGNQPSEKFYYGDVSEKSVGVRGNQIMNKGSAYTNLLKTYTDYNANERYKKAISSADEREIKRNKRFRSFKRINVGRVRNYIMKNRTRSTGSLFIIIPTFLAVIAGISNYTTTCFGMYLKYQPMVDMYYKKHLEVKENSKASETTTNSNRESTI